MNIPSLYAILDAEFCARRELSLVAVARAWHEAGLRLIQYRDKLASDAEYLENAAAILSSFEGAATLIVNDRVHLLAETGWHGVHLGQTDMSASEARRLIGSGKILGLSTHTAAQVEQADGNPVDYVAIGPVFRTTTKLDAEPVIGLAGVSMARTLTRKPLVAIGGITAEAVGSVLEAGADSVALISGLFGDAGFPEGLRRFL